MSLLEGIIDLRNNPLAVVEDIAADNNWAFERSGEDEVTIVSKGDWTDYQLSFTWMAEIEALHLACAFDMKIPPARRAEVQRLIARDQRAIMGRAFRHLDPHRHDHVPAGAGAAGRARPPRPRNARPCWSAPSTPASAITRRSSSWSGPARSAHGGHERGDVRYRGRGVGSPRRPRSPPHIRCRSCLVRNCARAQEPIRRDVKANCLSRLPRFTRTSCGYGSPRSRGRREHLGDVLNTTNALQNTSGTIALAGAGKMGGAMLTGWLAGGLDAARVVVIEPQPSAEISALAAKGVRLNPKDAAAADTLVVAVKPQIVPRGRAGAEEARRTEHAGGLDHGRHDDCGARGSLRRHGGSRHAEHAGRDRPRHHGCGRRRRMSAPRSAPPPTRCCAPPVRSNGSTTKA